MTGILQVLESMDPTTLAGLLAWVLSAVGLPIATSYVIEGAIRALAWVLGRDLTDHEQQIISVATPFTLVALAYGLQIILGYAEWSIDAAYQYIALAVVLVFGGQAAYNFFVKGWLHAG